MKIQDILQSPIGSIYIVADDREIFSISYEPIDGEIAGENALTRLTKKELKEYFDKRRTSFDLPLHRCGTMFQRAVYRALEEIPYGETRSYRQIADKIGRPRAARAVGAANHVNPFSIVIPCHRVIGKSGAMVGYGGGIPKKEYLLNLERGKEKI